MSDNGEPQQFLNVRETARRLGVHENTVRNWVNAGILQSARIPGSRFHRFSAEDVERLRRERGSSVSPIGSELRTIGPELVDATQLSQWAVTRDAQERFPELVRRLLASTPGVTEISIRSGDGVFVEGWDGRANSRGSAYLPGGSLCFEFGVSGKPKTKADEDYEKRRADPDGVDAPESIFVFATPRRWRGAVKWASERRAEGVFSDVLVLDADTLEAWLQDTPAVHCWISEHLGRRPRDAETLEQWWARFRARTDPLLPGELFLAGRDSEQSELAEYLKDSRGGAIAVHGVWRDEAIAFVCATIAAMGPDAANVRLPLLVGSSEVWDRVLGQPGGMTLIPLFENPDLAAAEAHGHHVVLPAGREQIVRGTAIELPRLHRQLVADALEAAGVESGRAYQLAGLARRSMPALVRSLARDTRIARPPWSQPPDGATIAPLVLIGAWAGSEADLEIVGRIARSEWPSVERILFGWRSTEDPPFIVSGGQWRLASPEEAFLVLHESLSTSDLARWEEIACEVLLELDPTLELAPQDRVTAGVTGVSRKYSSTLRRGIAEGIALMGSIGDDRLSDGTSGCDRAGRVVRQILHRANEDASGATWQSLTDVLPLLAEAAPTVFLDAVHEDLDQTQPALLSMFQDSDQSSWLYGSSPHTGLLWALETICWSGDYLLDATRALARLQALDPGGRLANRPIGSLENVLVVWIHQTSASLELRMRAVEQICNQMPEVGWRLVLGLWPSDHATSMPPVSPRFHDWRPASRHVQISEWIEYIECLVRLAIELAGEGVERWAQLAERLGPLPPAERTRLLDTLDAMADPSSLSTEERLLLWERMQKEIAHHRQFPDAEWSMSDEPLVRMQVISSRLEPTDSVERFAYLFDWRPDLPGIDPFDHEAHEKKLLELRTEAVEQTLEGGSTERLRALAERSPVGGQLGWLLGRLAPEDITPELLEWLDSENPKLREVALAWAAWKLKEEKGAMWMEQVISKPEMESRSRREALVLRAPPTSEIWGALARIDADLLNHYWLQMNPLGLKAEDVERAARELLVHGRAWAAVDLLALELHRPGDDNPPVNPALIEEVLDAAIKTEVGPNDRTQSLGYDVGRLLDYLEKADVDPQELATYEFLFFRLLDHVRFPRALYRSLSENPSFFVDLVSRVYRGKGEPLRELNEREKSLATHAWWVLNSWHGLPGRREDGTVDAEHLEAWVREARLALAESDRSDIGDEQIGQVLSASPIGSDGIWPCEPVRELLESIGSSSMETGIHIGVVNSRGVTTRGPYDGGKQERDLAARYREWAKQAASQWPRTSRILRRLAEDYERDARRQDERAELDADTT